MNHFFAIELSLEARQAVEKTVHEWKPLLSPTQSAKWHGPDDFHITLKFLGDLPESAQPALITAAAPIAAVMAAFKVELNGMGAFPHLRRPHVLWVGVRNQAALTSLAVQMDAALVAIGYKPEQRPYQPHVTVARCRPSRLAEEWPMPYEQAFSFWQAARFVLMRTLPPEQRTNGAKGRYNIVHTFPFGNTHSSDVS